MKHTSFLACLLPLGLVALLGCPALAAAEHSGPKDQAIGQDKIGEIDRVFGWVKPEMPGGAIAVSRNGKLIVSRAYGLADVEHGVPISATTVFDAGSLQKQFVAAAVLLLVEEGKLSLTEDIHAYLPELPDYGHTLTLDHLLTHTGGVRDWTGLLALSGEEADALTVVMRQRGLNFPPGEEFSYSNSGIVLAKEIVARKSGMSFADFTRTRMFEPLGMRLTSYAPDVEGATGDHAIGYKRLGPAWRPAMMLGRERGGGGVFSTPADLVTWADAIAGNRLGAFVSEKLQEPAALNSGRKLSYARGLFVENAGGVRMVWHSGSADGYQSYLAYFPEYDLSIAVMCNAGDLEQGDFAGQVFDILVPAAPKKALEGEGPPPVIPDGIDLSEKVGAYVSDETGEFLHLAIDRGRFRIAEGPGLVVIDENHLRRWGSKLWFMSGDPFELTFVAEDAFELKSADGRTIHYRRAKPPKPTAEELNALVGRYESEEMGSIIQIAAEGDALSGRFEHMLPEQVLRLTPVDHDTFQFSRMILRFRRDESGRVVAIDYSNPAVRKVTYTRLGDRQ